MKNIATLFYALLFVLLCINSASAHFGKTAPAYNASPQTLRPLLKNSTNLEASHWAYTPMSVRDIDTHGDGINDGSDNCPSVSHPLQEDSDGDAIGDVCDLCPYANAGVAKFQPIT